MCMQEFFFFWHTTACRDQTQALAVKAPSPNHWTAREFPMQELFFFFFLKFNLFIYLFIYGCVESSFLCEGFL